MRQTTDSVLMIRPAAFRSNPETAHSNAFQNPDAMPANEAAVAALAEFEGVVVALRDAGVRVCVVDDDPVPPRPDAIFPNNWLSTHEDGTVVLYPMQAPSRRVEVRPVLVKQLQSDFGFHISRVLDLTHWLEQPRFLEGTGSMVLDRVNRLAFACLSPRTDREVLEEFCRELGYRAVVFSAVDAAGIPIYHTNVQMWIGQKVAAVCLDAITSLAEREAVHAALVSGERELIELSLEQIAAFAGNMLELRGEDDHSVIVMSVSAHKALSEVQRDCLYRHAELVIVNIPSIERCSGGSVRCMLAELFLRKA